MRIAQTSPAHPFAEFLTLIAMKKINKRTQFVEPNSTVLERRNVTTSKNHHPSDEDDWGQRAITKQLAAGNQIPSCKRKS